MNISREAQDEYAISSYKRAATPVNQRDRKAMTSTNFGIALTLSIDVFLLNVFYSSVQSSNVLPEMSGDNFLSK